MGGGDVMYPEPPEPVDTQEMMNEMMGMITPMMNQMMSGMQSMMAGVGASAPPAIPNFPEIEMPEPMDFEAMEEEISQRARGQQAVETAQKYGETDTLHASLLLDEPETSDDNLLGGILV